MSFSRTLLNLFLGRRNPQTTGTLKVGGLSAPVEIRRDAYGIPHIDAASDADAFFAVGFCHAQDRAAQLETWLRLGRGTLSELVGKETIAVDRLLRRVGFEHSAKQQWPALAPHSQQIVTAYVDGINSGFDRGCPRRPHEYVFLGGEPSRWKVEDVLALTKLQCWFMACNWDSELSRLQVLLNDGPAALEALDPVRFDVAGLTDPSSKPGLLSTLERLREDLSLLGDIIPKAGGSNNWVVTPGKSKTGRPIVANDPHLNASIPAPWYLLSIRTPQWSVAGASFIGSPTIPSGHNGHAAWGVTAGLSDNTDLFIEELRQTGDRWEYRQGDVFLPCEVRREEIRVKKSASVFEEIPHTPRGPILSPSLAETKLALSIRAIWLDPLPLDGWLSAYKAKSFADFRHCFREWPAFPMNLVYADVSGKTGWQFVGQLPVRKRGHGLIPLPGWDDRNGWEAELVPFDQMPFVEDPPLGFVATANNRPRHEGDGAYLGGDWLDSYRHDVIAGDLTALEKVGLDDCSQIQQSVRCIPWQQIRDTILKVDHPATAILSDWDGHLHADSVAASVYEIFMCQLSVAVARAKAPKSAEWALGRGTTALNDHGFFSFRRFGHLVNLIRTQPDGWLPHGWTNAIKSALSDAVNLSRQKPWGTVRPLTFKHIMMGPSPLKSAFNLGPIPFGGDEHTPNHSSTLPLTPLGQIQSLPNLRTIIDVGNWSASRFQIAGGQSGNPASPHYDDLLPLWQKGEGVPVAFTPEEVRQATIDTLILELA